MRTWKKQVQALVHPRGGLLRVLKKIETQPGLPQMSRYLAIMETDGDTPTTIRGSGFASSEIASQQSAVGEAVERYCAGYVPTHKIQYSTYAERPGMAINPFHVTRPSQEQLPFHPYLAEVTSDSVFGWVQGIALSTAVETWIPIELVYQSAPPYKPLRDVISTGLACGPTASFAKQNALCECLERDAVMLFWLLGTVHAEILVEPTGDTEIELLLHRAIQSNLSVRFYDITQQDFGTPTVITVVQSKGRTGFYLGSSTAFSYRDAIRKSLQEGIGGFSVFYEFLHFYDRVAPDRPEDIHTLEDHSLYYMAGHQDDVLIHLFPSALPKRPIQEYLQQPPVTWSTVLESLVEHGHPAYELEVTTPDVKQVGLHVYRVVIPTLLFLPVGEPFLECERLREKQRHLQRDLNPLPHPFP